MTRKFFLDRLLDSSYSVQEVQDILASVKASVKTTVKTESSNLTHATTELLRQVFQQADYLGMTLKLDISSIENEYVKRCTC